jgi:hypothetical protein
MSSSRYPSSYIENIRRLRAHSDEIVIRQFTYPGVDFRLTWRPAIISRFKMINPMPLSEAKNGVTEIVYFNVRTFV